MAFRIETSPEIRAELDKIEEIILNSSHPISLLNVLSALRGPDNEDPDIKKAQTNWIRTVAFPRLTAEENGGSTPWMVNRSEEPDYISTANLEHFSTHIRLAYMALGIRFDGEL